jgi:hypothetical protein
LLFYKKLYLILLAAALSFAACNERDIKPPDQKVDLNSPEASLKEARKMLGNDVRIAVSGNFDEDTTKEIAAGTEINKPDQWGIQFHLLKPKDNKLEEVFSTAVLEGSFTDAMVRKEKLPTENHDMIYYNSLDYYLGSGGGEVFAYLIDPYRKQTYYSHLFTEKGSRISLYLSENITPEIKNFFLGVFKKDYPNLQLVDKDIDLDD